MTFKLKKGIRHKDSGIKKVFKDRIK